MDGLEGCLALRGEPLAISMQQRHLHLAGNLNGEKESCEKGAFGALGDRS